MNPPPNAITNPWCLTTKMNDLKIYLEKLLPFTEREMEVFTSLISEIQLKKNDYFAKEGEFSSRLAFISEGVMSAFFRNKSGHVYNKTLFISSYFDAAYSAITTKQKYLINLQCSTDCTLQVADLEKITTLFDDYSKIDSLATILAEYKF